MKPVSVIYALVFVVALVFTSCDNIVDVPDGTFDFWNVHRSGNFYSLEEVDSLQIAMTAPPVTRADINLNEELESSSREPGDSK